MTQMIVASTLNMSPLLELTYVSVVPLSFKSPNAKEKAFISGPE